MNVLLESLPKILEGFTMTLTLLVFSGLLAFALGMLIVTMRISPVSTLSGFAKIYTEFIRNTPLTLVLFFTAFLLPYLGFELGFGNVHTFYMVLAIIGLGFYTSPFVAEALRSGVLSIPVGQAEAARSIGLTFGQSLTQVVLPQAMRSVIPPLINVFIALTKNTSVAGGFAVLELFGVATALINQTGEAILILVGVAVFYLLITVPLGLIAGWIENKVVVLR